MASGYARLPCIYRHDLQDPPADADQGRIALERAKAIEDWADVASFVESDALADDAADQGTLLLYRHDDPSSAQFFATASE